MKNKLVIVLRIVAVLLVFTGIFFASYYFFNKEFLLNLIPPYKYGYISISFFGVFMGFYLWSVGEKIELLEEIRRHNNAIKQHILQINEKLKR